MAASIPAGNSGLSAEMRQQIHDLVASQMGMLPPGMRLQAVAGSPGAPGGMSEAAPGAPPVAPPLGANGAAQVAAAAGGAPAAGPAAAPESPVPSSLLGTPGDWLDQYAAFNDKYKVSTRIAGGLQLVAGTIAVIGGTSMALGGAVGTGITLGVAAPVSLPVALGGMILATAGMDNAYAGAQTLITGERTPTNLERFLNWATGTNYVGPAVNDTLMMASLYPYYYGTRWLCGLGPAWAAEGRAGAGAGRAAAELGELEEIGAAERITQPIGDLRAGGLKDAHHVIQDAAVRDLPGYNTNAAPGVQLEGPSTAIGSPHYNATQVQRLTGGGTYGAEREIGRDALLAAGYSEAEAAQAIAEADAYFESIGVTLDTPTRIPGNR
jgi:hypothetical protein